MSVDYFKQFLESENELYISSSKLLFESAHNHRIFKNEKEECLDEHVGKLTHLLTGNECKKTPLAQLLVLLPQCSEDIITKYGVRWVTECSRLLKAKQKNVLTPALLTLMRVVFHCCSNNRELSSNISKLNGSFLPQICSVHSKFGLFTCLCLAEFFNQFSTQAGSHKHAITVMLMQFLHLPLSTQDDATVLAAGRCFAAISVSGDPFHVMKAKSSKLCQLMSLAHAAMDVLFKDVSESEVYDLSRVHKLPNISLDHSQEDNPLAQLLMAVRITIHCFTFIRVFIETSTVEVQPRELALLVLRVLQVNINLASSSGNMEAMALSFILPSLHIYALRFMQALIKNRVCEPFTSSFEDQLIATLISTEKMGVSVQPVKKFCYEALTELVQVTNELSLSSLKKLLPLLKNDTVLMKHGIKLRKPLRKESLSVWSLKKKSRKKGKSLLSVEENVTEDRTQDAEFLSMTGSVLEFLEALFLTVGHMVPGKDVTVLQNRIWDLLYPLQQSEYVDTSIRIALYRLVLAFALHPHPLCPAPFAMIHWALERGTRDSNISVSEVCRWGLNALSFVGANPSVASWSNAAWQSGPAVQPSSEQDVAEKGAVFAAKKFLQNGGISEEERLSPQEEEQDSNQSDLEEVNWELKKVNGVEELASESDESEMEQAPSSDTEFLDEKEVSAQDDDSSSSIGEENQNDDSSSSIGDESLNDDSSSSIGEENQNDDSSSSIGDGNKFSSKQDPEMKILNEDEEEETSIQENSDQNGLLEETQEEEGSEEDDASFAGFTEEKVCNSSIQKRRKKSLKATKTKKQKTQEAKRKSDQELMEYLSTFVDSSPD